jgi:hypothetical protein
MYSSTSLENQVFIVEGFIQLNQTEERVTTEIDNEIKYIHTCYARYRLRQNQLTQSDTTSILLRLPTRVHFRLRTQGIHIKVQT